MLSLFYEPLQRHQFYNEQLFTWGFMVICTYCENMNTFLPETLCNANLTPVKWFKLKGLHKTQ